MDEPRTILLVKDNPADVYLIQRAIEECGSDLKLSVVPDERNQATQKEIKLLRVWRINPPHLRTIVYKGCLTAADLATCGRVTPSSASASGTAGRAWQSGRGRIRLALSQGLQQCSLRGGTLAALNSRSCKAKYNALPTL